MKGNGFNIQLEREKLNQMVEETLRRRIPISKNEDIQKQGRFLEQLIEKAKQANMTK